MPPLCQLALLAYFLFYVDPLESKAYSELTSSSWLLSPEAVPLQVGQAMLNQTAKTVVLRIRVLVWTWDFSLPNLYEGTT